MKLTSSLVLPMEIVTLLLCGCGVTSVGGQREQVGGQPVTLRDYCSGHCAEFSPDGRCVRFSADIADVCGGFLDRNAARISTDQSLDTKLNALAGEFCRALPPTQAYRLAVSLRGTGDENIAAREREMILAALERAVAKRCVPPHSMVARTALRPALEEIENSGLASNPDLLLARLRKGSIADILIVSFWRRDAQKVWISLQGLDVQQTSAQAGAILARSSEHLVSEI